MEWGRRALQSLLINAFHHGEIAPYQHNIKSGHKKTHMPTLDSASSPSAREETISNGEGEPKIDQGIVLDKDEGSSEPSLVVSEASVQVEQTDSVSVPTVTESVILHTETPSSVYPVVDSIGDSVSPISSDFAESVSAPPLVPEVISQIHQAVGASVESQMSMTSDDVNPDLVEDKTATMLSEIMKQIQPTASVSVSDIADSQVLLPVSDSVSPMSSDLTEDASAPLAPEVIKKLQEASGISAPDTVDSAMQLSANIEKENITETEKETNTQLLEIVPEYTTEKNAKDKSQKFLPLEKFKYVPCVSSAIGDTAASVQVHITEDTESKEKTTESESESKKGEHKTEKIKETPIKVFSSGVARKEYSKGDYSSLVGFPPKVRTPGGISRTDTGATTSIQGQQLRYQAFIISSSVDHRLLSSCQLSAELKLQSLAQNIYESILSSLMNAKPARPLVGLNNLAQSLDQAVFDGDRPFGKTTDLLVHSIESLLESAKQPRSNVNLVTVFEFWNELNSLVPMSSSRMAEARKRESKENGKKKRTSAFTKVAKTASHSPTVFTQTVDCGNKDTIPPLCSKLTFDLLLDTLLETSSTSPKLWQLGVTLTNTSIRYMAYFSLTEERWIDCEQKLSKMFVIRITTPYLRGQNISCSHSLPKFILF